MSQKNDNEPVAVEEQKRTLKFEKGALKEWKSLPTVASDNFRKKLKKALASGVPAGESLRGYTGHYRLKMMRPNYRLVYRWDDNGDITVTVIVVEPRAKVYETMKDRLK